MLHVRYTLGACLLVCKVSQKSITEISRYLWISTKRYNYALNWWLDLMQTNLLLFGCFRQVFITHSFCKWPLYTLQPAKRDFEKKHENMLISKTQCWAFFVLSIILRLLLRKRRLNQNSSTDFLLKISVLRLISVL